MLSALLPMAINEDNNSNKEDGMEKISISLERLQENFVVSLKEFICKQTEQGLYQAEEAEVEEPELADAVEVQDHLPDGSSKEKKKNKRNIKAPKIEDYDVEDPFIDDSEVAAVYESVFDLMLLGEDSRDDPDSAASVPERERSTHTAKRPLTVKDFYVYRGPIEVELVEKYQALFVYYNREFDEPKKKKKKKKPKKSVLSKEGSSQAVGKILADDGQEATSQEPSLPKKRAKKRKPDESSTDSLQSGVKKGKRESMSLTERLQQLEAEIEEREGKSEDVKMGDEPEEDVKSGNVRRFYDIDKVSIIFGLISPHPLI